MDNNLKLEDAKWIKLVDITPNSIQAKHNEVI